MGSGFVEEGRLGREVGERGWGGGGLTLQRRPGIDSLLRLARAHIRLSISGVFRFLLLAG